MARRTTSQENMEVLIKESREYYIVIVVRNSCQLCYNGIEVTIVSITGLTCFFHVVYCPTIHGPL